MRVLDLEMYLKARQLSREKYGWDEGLAQRRYMHVDPANHLVAEGRLSIED